MLVIVAIAAYIVVRYGIGLLVKGRYTAAALTFTSLSAIALYAFGPVAGGRTAGVLFVCALIDGAWKRTKMLGGG